MTDELADQLAGLTIADQKEASDPRAAYGRVVAELKDRVPEAGIHVKREIGRARPSRGYVYALTDQEADECQRVYINWAGPTKLREQLARLQVGNPNKLRVVAVLQRDHVADAKLICDMMFGGLMLRLLRGNWFSCDSEQKMAAAFGRVDRLVADEER